MLDRVCKRLLDDPVGAQVERRRQHRGLTVDEQIRAQARCARAGEQILDVREPRLRRERPRVPVGVEDAEQPAHLGERLAARALDRPQRSLGTLRLAIHHRPCGAGLNHHHRDAVRDHVVELTRDPRPLAVGRLARMQLTPSVKPLRRLSIGTFARSRAARTMRPSAHGSTIANTSVVIRLAIVPPVLVALLIRGDHDREPQHPQGPPARGERAQPVGDQQHRRDHSQLVLLADAALAERGRHSDRGNHCEHRSQRPATTERDRPRNHHTHERQPDGIVDR